MLAKNSRLAMLMLKYCHETAHRGVDASLLVKFVQQDTGLLAVKDGWLPSYLDAPSVED